MTTRTPLGPDMRHGTTLHLITDMHAGAHGNATWLNTWFDRARDDILALKNYSHGHVFTGDCIHWDKGPDQPMEDTIATNFRESIIQGDKKPFVLVDGNHDLDSYDASDLSASRTAAQWARDVGWPDYNTFTEINGMWVCAFSPESKFSGVDGWFISDATVRWIDDMVKSVYPAPVVLADHCPPNAQYPAGDSEHDNMYNVDDSSPGLVDVIASNDNIKMFVNGHLHVDINNQNHARIISIGGRRLVGVNGPPFGGGLLTSVANVDHQWQNVCQSTYITYAEDLGICTVRWRDHLRKQWATSQGDHTIVIPLPVTPTTGYGSGLYGAGPYGG